MKWKYTKRTSEGKKCGKKHQKNISILCLTWCKYSNSFSWMIYFKEGSLRVKQLILGKGHMIAFFSGSFPIIFFRKTENMVPNLNKKIREERGFVTLCTGIWNISILSFLYSKTDGWVVDGRRGECKKRFQYIH